MFNIYILCAHKHTHTHTVSLIHSSTSIHTSIQKHTHTHTYTHTDAYSIRYFLADKGQLIYWDVLRWSPVRVCVLYMTDTGRHNDKLLMTSWAEDNLPPCFSDASKHQGPEATQTTWLNTSIYAARHPNTHITHSYTTKYTPWYTQHIHTPLNTPPDAHNTFIHH